jgi:DNA-directed RNA polymerase subunit L
MSEKKIEFKDNDFDIKIKETDKYESDGLNSHYLTLEFEGSDLNVKIINMLRRACTNHIPIYAFPVELINIIENSSIAFNNDMMKLDLSFLPVYNVDPEIYELDEEYWYNVNYADNERKKFHGEKNIEFYLSYHNNSSDIVRVTTNDAQVYIDGKQVEMYNKKYPILLIELKANQTFKCHMKAVLGVAERRDDGALWKSCKRAYYTELDKEKNKFSFTVYGNEQFSEYQLLIRTCQFLIYKLYKIKKMISDKVKKGEILPEKTIKFVFENEDHTIGEPINYELQDHKSIIFSGFSKADHLIKTGVITASAVKNDNSPINPLLESIEILSNKIHKIGFLLEIIEMGRKKKKEKKEKEEEEEEKDIKDIKEKDKKKKK